VTILLDFALRSSVMLALGLLLVMCLTRRSAALRHRVLAATLFGAIGVMPLRLALPDWTVTLPIPPPEINRSVTRALVTDVPRVRTELPNGTPYATRPAASGSAAVSPFVLIWLAGVMVIAGTLIAGLVRVTRVASRASPLDDNRWIEVLDRVRARYGLSRRVAVSRTDSLDLLATWGVFRPQVLLPRAAAEWPLDRVHIVFSHELAHISRHDWLVQIGAESVRAMLWFNPLAWIVCARLRRESEQACDDEVLATGVGGREYAGHLLALARQCRRPPSAWASVVPMAHPSTLERRITAMLNPRLARQAPSRRVIAIATAAFMVVAIPVAALRARQAGPAPLSGTVYDITGGVMPGVQVTLVDSTEVSAKATSNASGGFQFASVAAGKYVLEAAVPGFRALRHEFELRDAADWNRAVTLQVSELKETVSVRESRMNVSAQAGAPPQPARVGGNIRAPRKEVHVAPVYPVSMREAGLTGVVPVEALIGRDGTVTSVRVLSAQVHPDFVIAAVDAVRQWRFTPTLLNGVAVEVVMRVSVAFDLDD
jgi:TonB family protein